MLTYIFLVALALAYLAPGTSNVGTLQRYPSAADAVSLRQEVVVGVRVLYWEEAKKIVENHLKKPPRERLLLQLHDPTYARILSCAWRVYLKSS